MSATTKRAECVGGPLDGYKPEAPAFADTMMYEVPHNDDTAARHTYMRCCGIWQFMGTAVVLASSQCPALYFRNSADEQS